MPTRPTRSGSGRRSRAMWFTCTAQRSQARRMDAATCERHTGRTALPYFKRRRPSSNIARRRMTRQKGAGRTSPSRAYEAIDKRRTTSSGVRWTSRWWKSPPPLALLVASPARLYQNRHRRRQAASESSRRPSAADLVVRVSSDITAPPALLVASPARLYLPEPTPATPSKRRAASESSRRRSAADLVARAPAVPSTHVRAAVSATVRRVAYSRLLLSSSHRRLGSIRAGTGDA